MEVINISKEDIIRLIDERLDLALDRLLGKIGGENVSLVSRFDLAKKFNKSPETIDAWEKSGDLPKAVKMGAKKFFIWEEVCKKIKSNR